MSKKKENTAFTCVACGLQVLPSCDGSYRNHCPRCLCSVHVDIDPGDRAHSCQGLMVAEELITKTRQWQVVHRCQKCGHRKANRIATGPVQPDDIEALIRLCQKR